jgi:hypothetical protein
VCVGGLGQWVVHEIVSGGVRMRGVGRGQSGM